jgi:hypothetical protein
MICHNVHAELEHNGHLSSLSWVAIDHTGKQHRNKNLLAKCVDGDSSKCSDLAVSVVEHQSIDEKASGNHHNAGQTDFEQNLNW